MLKYILLHRGRVNSTLYRVRILCFMEDLPKEKNRFTVGRRETFRAMHEGKIARVILAENCDKLFKHTVRLHCITLGVPCTEQYCREKLGFLSGIDVPCGVIGIYKDAVNHSLSLNCDKGNLSK